MVYFPCSVVQCRDLWASAVIDGHGTALVNKKTYPLQTAVLLDPRIERLKSAGRMCTRGIELITV